MVHAVHMRVPLCLPHAPSSRLHEPTFADLGITAGTAHYCCAVHCHIALLLLLLLLQSQVASSCRDSS